MHDDRSREGRRRHGKIKGIVAWVLAIAAGCVDIIGYISFGHAFTAHLTGNTVHLGQGLISAQWQNALRAATIIAAFTGGSIVARAVIEIGSRLRVRTVAVLTLLLEGILIVFVIAFSPGEIHSVLLLSAAMGVQTATLTRVGPLTVHTTFVTGMLNKFAQLLSHTAFLSYDIRQGRPAARQVRRKVLREAGFIFGVWMMYLVGAVAGTLAQDKWGLNALWLPTIVILLVAGLDLIAPLSVEEEKDVSER